MHTHLRSRVLGTAAITISLIPPILAAATPASASGGDSVIARGACAHGGHFKLKAKHDDGRIEVEFEVDSNRSGQRWAVRITDNGATVVSRHATPAGPSGSFTVRKNIANRAGRDKVRARATFRNHTCTGSVTL
jgi:hypothetical protein